MKKAIVLLCALNLALAYNTAFAASTSKVTTTTLNDIPPAWSKTLQCDTTACPRFELVLGGAAVLDHETGLVWEQSPNGTTTYAWTNAFLACQDMNIGNRLGWRLPTIEELASLVDPTVASPGPTLPSGNPFSNVQQGVYWSATSWPALLTDTAWGMSLSSGHASGNGKANTFYVWCVRGRQGYDGH